MTTITFLSWGSIWHCKTKVASTLTVAFNQVDLSAYVSSAPYYLRMSRHCERHQFTVRRWTLTPPDTWSYPIWDHSLLNWLWISIIPRYTSTSILLCFGARFEFNVSKEYFGQWLLRNINIYYVVISDMLVILGSAIAVAFLLAAIIIVIFLLRRFKW